MSPLEESALSARIRWPGFAPARARRAVVPFAVLLALAEPARAQCDPDVVWEVFPPTGDVAEVLIAGETAWIGAQGGVIRVDLTTSASGAPVQSKITDREGLVSTAVTAMARDSFGNLWVGTRSNGITVLSPSGTHVADLSSFTQLWSDHVLAIAGEGDRMIVSCADGFTPQGNPEGGGFVIITITPDGSGGYEFASAPGTRVEVARSILAEENAVWFGTSGRGLYVRDESVTPADFREELTAADGLASPNVKQVVRAPKFPSGTSVLWLGTGAGLQNYDPVTGTLETISQFAGQNILDLFVSGSTLWIAAEAGTERDVYRLDLAATPAPIRIPRASCATDTSYVPRHVAVDAAGRLVLGTRSSGYFVREGITWHCPPPLGPHFPQVADLAVEPDGRLYFGTGEADNRFPGNGVGVFDGADWTAITRDQGIVASNMTQVMVWGDGTVWMGTSISRTDGGVNRYFPQGGAIEAYHPSVAVASRRTQGRNCRSIEMDAAGNAWLCYGQNPGGGLSVVEAPPSLRVTNYDFDNFFFGTNLLRDLAFDTSGRIWVCTHTTNTEPAMLYALDTRGTVADLSDDRHASFQVPTLLPGSGLDLGECKDIEIDGEDRIWIAGEKGLALGRMTPGSWPPVVSWQRISPSATQSGGRNPLPYEVAALDWDDNLWLGTEAAGLVRISNDLATWTWFDQAAGCPLPDQAVRGIHVDKARKRVWVGTATGGIARLDLSAARAPGQGEGLPVSAYPNPWNPERDGALRWSGIPADQIVDLRVYTLGGEVVHEATGTRGDSSWDGTNLGDVLVESGVYVITARATSGATYEGKVAVLR